MDKRRNIVRLSDEEWAHITTKLHKGSVEERALAEKIEQARTSTTEDQAFMDATDTDYSEDGRIEIDNDAVISRSEDGAYVQAWAWVANDRAGVYKVGDNVVVHLDTLRHEFMARVTRVRDDGKLIYTVVDQDDDAFDVEGHELELNDES